MIETIRQGLQADGITVSIAKLCRWFDVPRRTVYYKPVKSAPKVDAKFAAPIKALIEESPSFGYRTVAYLLGLNKNTVQRVFQLMGRQVRKLVGQVPLGHYTKGSHRTPRPDVEAILIAGKRVGGNL